MTADYNRFCTSDGYTFYRVAVTGQLASQFRARGRRPLIMWCDSRDPSKVDLSFHEDCGGHPIDVGGVRLDGEFG